jgi:hypothetical protein
MSNIDENKKDFYVDVNVDKNMNYDMDYDMNKDINKDMNKDMIKDMIKDINKDMNKHMNKENKKFDNKELSVFLRELADSIDKETIESNNLKIVGEFYMKYKFNNFKKDGKTYEFTEEEIVKFIFLGWFIYNIILKDSELHK